MSRYELRYAARHPLRWARHFWLHLTLSALLALLAIAWGDPIFDQAAFAPLWPLLLSWLAGLIIATSLAPFSRWLLAVTGAAMMTVGILRALALSEVWLYGDATQAVVLALIVKEGLLFALGAVWPTWTRACGAGATVEAGADDRGGGGA